MEKKPWYKSKIVAAGLVLILTAVSDAVFGFVSGNGITVDQVQVIQTAYPAAAEGIKDAVAANDVFRALSAATGFLVAIWRVWFSPVAIQQPF